MVLWWDLSIVSYYFWALLEVTILSIRQNSKQADKSKHNENIHRGERRKKYTRSINYSKKFHFGEIQQNIQWDQFSPLSPTKGQLSYQHWKSEITSHIRHFKSWLRFIPVSQRSPSKPEGHKHWYPLTVNPDWQVALFSQWEFLSQAFLRRKHKIKWNNERKIEGLKERNN